MQDRMQVQQLLWKATALLALAITASGAACTDGGPLTDGEMDQLRTFMLPTQLPPDPSNSVADDQSAALLGQQFFFEHRFAGPLLAPFNAVVGANGALGVAGQREMVSCASCHDPTTAGIDRRSTPNATSLGAGYTGRNAPTVINAAYSPLWQFWDGRIDSLWGQALGPPEGQAEYNSNRMRVAKLLSQHYADPYNRVFPDTPMPDLTAFPDDGKPGEVAGCQTDPVLKAKEPYDDAFDCLLDDNQRKAVNQVYANFGKAIAAYERLLVSAAYNPSPFDQFMAGDKDAMSPAAIRGARLFIGHAGCAECHRGSMFTDYGFHNIGAPQVGEYVKKPDNGRIDGVGPLTRNMFSRGGAFSNDTSNTAYLSVDTTQLPASMTGQFKTPSLRNVSKTAPYMHDGAYQTLWDVVNHYNFGGVTGNYAGDRDPAIAPLMLSDAELADLVEFLEALNDGDFAPDTDQALFAKPSLPDE